MSAPRSLFDKIWERHAIITRPDGAVLLRVGRHMLHEGSRAAFRVLDERKLPMADARHTFGTSDHYVPTSAHTLGAFNEDFRRDMVEGLAENAALHGFTSFGMADARQGIVHVVGPEQGITLPGIVMVCGDSHTSSHGALGALAFGIGASEVAHVLATQALWQSRKPEAMRITVGGTLGLGVYPKDVILAIIGKIGAAGASGTVIEYAGEVFRAMSIEGRLTVCNMSIEAGARAGMMAPDEKVFAYLKGRPFAPPAAMWEKAVAFWRTLPSDPDTEFTREVSLEGAAIVPMATWGTSPEHGAAITDAVPDPASYPSAESREAVAAALKYMGLEPGMPMEAIPIGRVFIGSCTNARIEDLRVAANVLRGHKTRVPAWVVPGSSGVKRQAEAEGVDQIFRDAGFEWRESGCSMCVAMNGDHVEPGVHCASTSNRNFVGRQGRGARTHLMSPAMAAAAAITGHITDVRRVMAGVM